jgi:hypothetical protein
MTCGDRLEDVTNKLRPDEYIKKFVSVGPKSCAYRTVKSRILDRKTA